MNSEEVTVFFYGLFMDESLLASKGIRPSRSAVGYVDGYALRIARRATLVPDPGKRAYGVLMTLHADDVKALYSDGSLAEYIPETVLVSLPDGKTQSAACYILPEGMPDGTNPEYANDLLNLATGLDFPDEYLRHIREQAA